MTLLSNLEPLSPLPLCFYKIFRFFEVPSLLKKIQEIPEWKNTWINIGWSLSFPDVKIPRQPLFLDVPHELVLDSLSMQNSINDWVVNAFNYLDQNILRKESIVDYRKINSLIQILAPSWEFQINVSSDIEKQENIIKRLTDEQFVVLDFLSRHRRVAISGCAGSGKTLVALEKANRLSQEGFNVLLLCNNPNLADFLCKKINDNRIHVKDFFAWINNILDKKEFEIINFEWSEFLELPQKYLDEAFDKITTLSQKYDAIIVDEGQDFRDTWWLIVEAALKDEGKSILYIFHDDNQALYVYGSQFKYPITESPYTLSKNCRNSGNIFKLIQKIHPSSPEPSSELLGKGIVQDFICTSDNAINKTFEAIQKAQKLISDQHNLVVLTAEIGSPKQSILSQKKILSSTNETVPKWQKSIQELLNINSHELTTFPYPTVNDIEKIVLFAQKNIDNWNQLNTSNCYENTISDPASRLRWKMRQDGELELRGFSEEKSKWIPDYKKRVIWYFFSNSNWANRIPKVKNNDIKIVAYEKDIHNKNEGNIPLHSVASFKGLEADGVILFYWGHFPTGDDLLAINTLYVGLSRAKHLLYFISPIPLDEILRKIKNNIYSPNPNLFRLD